MKYIKILYITSFGQDVYFFKSNQFDGIIFYEKQEEILLKIAGREISGVILNFDYKKFEYFFRGWMKNEMIELKIYQDCQLIPDPEREFDQFSPVG